MFNFKWLQSKKKDIAGKTKYCIYECNEKPLEVFINKVTKEANRVKENKQKEVGKSNFYMNLQVP